MFNVLGYDTIKAGLHRYFQTYKWKNTTLPDFVGCLQWAYDQSGDKSMGEDFNFTEWCDSWLKSSGVNILEPVVEYNDDSSVKTFSIRQLNDLRGKNRLRKQKLNVGFYDQDMKLHEIKGIVISDKEALNPVNFDYKGPVRAIIINHDDHGYAKVRYDEKTLGNLEEALPLIEMVETRSQVWRQLWLHVMDKKLSSIQYFQFILKAMPKETVEQTLSSILMNLGALINYYMPTDMIKPSKEKMFSTLLGILETVDSDVVKGTIVDSLFQFASSKEHLDLIQAWNKAGFVHSAGSPDTKIFEIKKSHKISIVKCVYKSADYGDDHKKALMEEVLVDDKSDLATQTRLTCEAMTNDPVLKEKIWQELIDPKTTCSLYERRSKMAGFYSSTNQEVYLPYYDKFYDYLSDLHVDHTYKYIESFFYSLLPRKTIEDRHIVKLMTIKTQVADTNNMYMNVLQDGIELLIRSKTIREYAQSV